MSEYLARARWAEPTPLGGKWAWVTNAAGLARGVEAVGVSHPEERVLGIDRRLDDGDFATGLFRKVSDGVFIYGVE